MNSRNIMYGGIVGTCLMTMSYNSFMINRMANVQEFVKNLFHEKNIIPLAILGALQIKLCDAIFNRYLEN